MFALVHSLTLNGIEAVPVQVEVDVQNGLSCFELVGLPSASIREAKERVRSAIKNSGFEFPLQRITVNLAPADLRKELNRRFGQEQENPGFHVNVVSFGFKNGAVLDADLLFDVRFLPNPHYVPDLQSLTGEDPQVDAYVMKWDTTQQFYRRLTGLIGFLLPHYVAEGKSLLTIAIGCTGGKHRSVCLARRLADWIRDRGYSVSVEHRDLPSPADRSEEEQP